MSYQQYASKDEINIILMVPEIWADYLQLGRFGRSAAVLVPHDVVGFLTEENNRK